MKQINVIVKNESSSTQETFVFVVSPLLSFFEFRHRIEEKCSIKDSIKCLYFQGKKIYTQGDCSYDSTPLVSLGFVDGCQISVTEGLSGGNNTTNRLFWVLYYVCLIGYVFFLMSGFITLFANVFSVTFNNTIFQVLDSFIKDKSSTFSKGVKLFVVFVGWVLKNFATLAIVWILTSYMVFPWFYGKGNRYCESALASKQVGWWAMFVFGIVYVYMNLGDFIFNLLQFMVTQSGVKLAEATISPSLQSFKQIWDKVKLLVVDLLPGVSMYHRIVEAGIYLLYEALGVVGTVNCNDVSSVTSMCSFFSSLYKVSSTKKVTLQTLTSEVNKLKKKMPDISDISSMVPPDIVENVALSTLKPTIRDYHLGPAIELLSVGFCDKANQLRSEKEGTAYVPLELKDERGKEYTPGSFNRWSAGAFTSFFCQIVESMNDISNIFNSIGTDNQVVNMIETGNVAGIGASIYLFVVLVYTFFSNSYSGYTFK